MGLGMGAEAACDACHGTKGQATQPDLNKATQADLDKAAKLNLDKADKATDLKATQSNLDKATDLKATKPNLDKAMDLKSDVKQGSPFDVGPVATGFVDLGLKDLGKPGHAGSSLKPEPKVIPPRFSKPEIAIPKKRKSPHKPYIPKNEELEEVHVDQDEDSDDVMEVRSQPAPKKMPVEKDAKAAKAYKIFEERTKKRLAQKRPVFQYLFNHSAKNGPVVSHNDELPFVWRGLKMHLSTEEWKLSAEVAMSWYHFAATGNPSTDVLTWPQIQGQAPTLMLKFQVASQGGNEVMDAGYRDEQCNFMIGWLNRSLERARRRGVRGVARRVAAANVAGLEGPKMCLVVFGGTGYIGRATVKELAARGHEVVVCTRSKSGIGGKESLEDVQRSFAGEGNITVVEGDVTDPAALDALFASLPRTAQGAVCCLASRSGGQDSFDIDYQATVNCVEASRRAKLAQFVLLSAVCVQRPLLAFQEAKLKAEAACGARNRTGRGHSEHTEPVGSG
eukprot:g33551.t1